MIDILKDIVKHTHGLGFLDLVKITGDDKETVIDSMAEDRSVILQGSFHKPQTEMTGTFGMPQMGGYSNPFGQSFYGGLGSFMGQPSFPQQGMPQQSYDRFGMPIHQGPTMTNEQPKPAYSAIRQLSAQQGRSPNQGRQMSYAF